jgi:biotin-[acetyl-CoA-carboxylase] ligase BirA-like protein
MRQYAESIERTQTTNQIVEHDGLIVFPEIDTTMRVVDEAIAEGKPDGYTAIALTQTNGVGSRDPKTGVARTWWSGEGNLMASQIVEILPRENAQEIQMIASLVIGEIVRDLVGIEKNITWKYPNDVLVNGAKISGVLARPRSDGADANKVNLGIGVNIAATPPDDVLREKSLIKAVTCLRECGRDDVSIADFLELFDRKFTEIMHEFRAAYRLEDVLERMGLVQPGTYLMSIRTAKGNLLNGYFTGFSTQENENGIPVDYMHFMIDGNKTQFPSRDLNIGRWVRPSPHGLQTAPHFDHG